MLIDVILILPLLNAVKGYLLKDVERNEIKIIEDDPPAWFDWRDHGALSPVKNQMHCEACWAFSIVDAVESHRKIYLNVTELLSEQFLIDCVGNYGCNNAPILMPLGYIVGQYYGIYRAKHYRPYQDKQTACDVSTSGPLYSVAPVTGFRRVINEMAMAQAIYQHGPVIAAINSASMTKYTNGIDEPTEESCDPNVHDHAVLVVGYNTHDDGDKVVPYWIIKNSWGEDWGNHGYYYLVRGKNACGISYDISFPFVN